MTGTTFIEKYKHEGQQFTKEIAAELIFKTYIGKPLVDETILLEQVYQTHIANGGLPPEVRVSKPNSRWSQTQIDGNISFTARRYARSALSILHSNCCARRDEHDPRLWYIHEMDIHRDEREYPKRHGKGSQEVYCYYYRTYREYAVRQIIDPVWKSYPERIRWECKIGETHDQDTETRVKQQTGMPEKPIIALILKTRDSRRLEGIIHDILKYLDRQVIEAHAPRKDWFWTSPDEVEAIYNSIQHGFYS